MDSVRDDPGELVPERINQEGKLNLDLLEQEIVSCSVIIWVICKSAPCSRQVTMPASYHSVFYRPDAIPATQNISVKALKAKSPFHAPEEGVQCNKYYVSGYLRRNTARKIRKFSTVLWTSRKHLIRCGIKVCGQC